jgi:hypothetical protein
MPPIWHVTAGPARIRRYQQTIHAPSNRMPWPSVLASTTSGAAASASVKPPLRPRAWPVDPMCERNAPCPPRNRSYGGIGCHRQPAPKSACWSPASPCPTSGAAEIIPHTGRAWPDRPGAVNRHRDAQVLFELMGTPPSRTMARIIEVLRDGPRDRAAIAGALKLREPTTASVLTAMEFRQIVLKEENRYSLLKGHA